ncbi:MAG: serine/threonine-protein phosphatase [Phycisphaerales bacterium]|nr:MAG: serine/threonine-protein phosphatase [Phycisphaerales bacterium]
MVITLTDEANNVAQVSGPLRWGAATDIGKVREETQDGFAAEPEAGLFVVIDGMGGHRGGQVAAQMIAQDLPPAIELAIDHLRSRRPRSIRRALKRVISQQNRHVHLEGDSESGYVGMGATLVVVLLLAGRVYVANVGDSRVYRWRAGRLRQLSVDHSVVSELLEAGHITSDEVHTHDALGVVTQYMGMPEGIEPSVRSLVLAPGDRFLLCTDGLTDMVDEGRISETLELEADPQVAAKALVAAANNAGGHDNVTTIVVHWKG